MKLPFAGGSSHPVVNLAGSDPFTFLSVLLVVETIFFFLHIIISIRKVQGSFYLCI